jgi:hypothetical protein
MESPNRGTINDKARVKTKINPGKAICSQDLDGLLSLSSGRIRHAKTIAIGYSIGVEKIKGARRALNAPPSTPPNAMQK